MRLPFFVWCQFVTAFLLLLAFPPLEAAIIMQLMDRLAATSFFLPSGLVVNGAVVHISGGGSSLLWRHLFWFLGHPEVYVLILPEFGIVTWKFLANNSRKPLWELQVARLLGSRSRLLSFIVWAHHMWLTGMGSTVSAFFQTTTVLISIPSVIILSAFFISLWGGSIRFNVPMLFATAFLPMFGIGGLMLAGFRSPPSTLRRLADLVDTSTLRRFHAQLVAVPPAGAAASAPIASATAACAAGAAQNDGAVPLVVLPPSGRCGVELERWRSPCATGETTVPGRVFVGGQATGARVRAAADGGFFAQVLPGAARAGSVVLEYGCRRGAATRAVLEWGGEIATPDATFTAVERRTGARVPFARVTLQRSAAAGAPFGPLPAGLVGPALTAETTGPGGVVRWALPQGRFRLKLIAFGYRPLTTGLLRLPVAAAGVRLVLTPDPRQRAKLVRLAGTVGTLRLGARVRAGLRVAGLRLRVVRRRLRGVTVSGRAFRTAAGIRLRSPLAALRQAYPVELRAVRVRARGATTVRVQHVTFTLRRGVVTAIALR